MIYFIRNTHDGLIKIGYSAVPDARLKQLQTSTPYRLEMIGTIEGDITLERKLHAQLASERVGMEWFKNSERTLREIDLLLNPYPVIDGRTIRSVYLAGKISGTTWRDEIMPTWSQSGRKEPDDNWFASRAIPTPGGRLLDCTGPFFLNVFRHHHQDLEGVGPHRYGEEYGPLDMNHGYSTQEFIATDRGKVASKIKDAIFESDMVFAWLDSTECYGTLVEIGLAVAYRKFVVVAAPFMNRELWVAFSVAKQVDAQSPKEAWLKAMLGEVYAAKHGDPICDISDVDYQNESYESEDDGYEDSCVFGPVNPKKTLGIYFPNEDLN